MPPVPQICTFRFVVERLDGAADRLAELIAAIARRRRVLHDVHRERNHAARPRLRLPEHQRQRHGQAVVDVHPVDDGEIEVVLDHRLRDVRRRAPDGPCTTGTGRGPQPSSAGANSSAQPIANVGMMSRLNAVA